MLILNFTSILTFEVINQHISCQKIQNGQKDKNNSCINTLMALGIKAKEDKSNGWVRKRYSNNGLRLQ
jgi:hypothetical protein